MLSDKKDKQPSTPRTQGGGDGRQTRTPVSSARKFTCRPPKGEPLLKPKLEKALLSMDVRNVTPKRPKCIERSISVAEITPTATKKKRVSSNGGGDSSIYATPRPLSSERRRRGCVIERGACAVYRRLLLLAWRRTRSRLASLDESVRRRDDQISNFQMQVDALNELRQTETDKRSKALMECQKFKKRIHLLETENNKVKKEYATLEQDLTSLGQNLAQLTEDNLNLKGQVKTFENQFAENDVNRRVLEEKISTQQEDISAQQTKISYLEKCLRNTEESLRNSEVNCKLKERKYSQLKSELKIEMKNNNVLLKQIENFKEYKIEIENRADSLEYELNNYMHLYRCLEQENKDLRDKMEVVTVESGKKISLVKNSKRFILLSLMVLQKIAHTMLPAYL